MFLMNCFWDIWLSIYDPIEKGMITFIVLCCLLVSCSSDLPKVLFSLFSYMLSRLCPFLMEQKFTLWFRIIMTIVKCLIKLFVLSLWSCRWFLQLRVNQKQPLCYYKGNVEYIRRLQTLHMREPLSIRVMTCFICCLIIIAKWTMLIP